jgi:hydrogenase maturation protein HypF
VVSLIAEAGLELDAAMIGVAFDGTGYGTDGAIWGGEVLLVRGAESERFAHLKYVPLAGGDAAVKSPARAALSHLRAAGIAWDADLPCVAEFTPHELRILDRQMERGLNCVETSSMGRLFDAVAALTGVRQRVSYEGQAAIELESLCGDAKGRVYASEVLDPTELLRGIVADVRAGVPREEIAAGFHDAIAGWVVEICRRARAQTGWQRVGLTGGVFQNVTLLRKSVDGLRAEGFQVLVHRKVPANDGGLALGQAVLAGCP